METLTHRDFFIGEIVSGGWQVVKVGKGRVTIRLHNARTVVARDFTFIWDGTGYKRQGQYLREDCIK